MPRKVKPLLPHANKATKHALAAAQTDALIDADEGRKKYLTDDEVAFALERLANGDTMINVTKEMGVTRSAFWSRALQYPEFGAALTRAIEIGMLTRVENAENAVWGGVMSTGSIERDKLVADFTKWMAARLNRKVFGDKPLIEAHGLTINMSSNSDDVC